MNQYKRLNIIFGWISFLVAAVVYLMTIEPTVSLWDCGEFIASAYKLEVGHPPGAPFFMIMARFFSLFASGPDKVAMMVNSMSALVSALTIMFLFWTITHLASKIIRKDGIISQSGSWIAIGSGLVGAMAYTFSDTFWFSAVEGEVYAFSSLFTAVVFWAVLKWENEADQKHANRWLILIAYLMGLSIGVHLLNLLAIPAIVLVYYFRKYEVSRKGIIMAMGVATLILCSVMYGIIPGLFTVASKFELLFVNSFGLGFNSGLLVYLVLLLGSLGYGIYVTHMGTNETGGFIATSVSLALLGIPFMSGNGFLNFMLLVLFTGGIYILKKKREVLNSILLFMTVVVIGYSSFAMIMIRSLAEPPMDENNPDNVFALISYLNREQYGDRPLFHGQYYTAPHQDQVATKPVYSQVDGKYVITDHKRKLVYYPEITTIFPRMYSGEKQHMEQYQFWGEVKGKYVTIKTDDGKRQRVLKPKFSENLRFFFRYQVGFMYFRYFMWNFSGRQNDEQSHGEKYNGQWISGINFLDKGRAGTSENLPERYKNHHGRNVYYMLPFLLGLIGLFFQAQKHSKDFVVVLFLFILTGLAIVVYLNQTPVQPRERDYAYAGSFYAYCIWIGLGALAIFDGLKRIFPGKLNAALTTALCLVLVPGIMARENWDDHDRSGRYTARDLARDYLESCAPNAILFTNGDNDTFPLWYAQEVEGIRTDVRVCNLMLLNTDWYIDQMKRKAYTSDPLPISMDKSQYRQGTRDVAYFMPNSNKPMHIKSVIEIVKSDDLKTKYKAGNEYIDLVPTNRFRMEIDAGAVINSGTVKPEDADLIEPVIEWSVPGRTLTKSDLAVLDILANNNWERPIYFVSLSHSGTLNLDHYMQLEGFAYRLVPIKTEFNSAINAGRIDTEIMYDNLMNKFSWGRMNEPDVLIEYYNRRTFNVMMIRNKFLRLATKLNEEGANEKAIEVLREGFDILPDSKMQYDYFNLQMIYSLYDLGDKERADKESHIFVESLTDELDFFNTIERHELKSFGNEIGTKAGLLQRLQQVCEVYNPEIAAEIKEKISGYEF